MILEMGKTVVKKIHILSAETARIEWHCTIGARTEYHLGNLASDGAAGYNQITNPFTLSFRLQGQKCHTWFIGIFLDSCRLRSLASVPGFCWRFGSILLRGDRNLNIRQI